MKKVVGAQYYTLRDYTQTIEDFDETCKKVSQMGYKTVQISGTSLPAREMKPILEKYNLPVIATHRAMDAFENNIEDVVEYNKILGSPVAGLGAMDIKYAQTIEGIKDFCNKVNEYNEIFKKEGLIFGYHNHAFEFSKLEGKLVYDYIIENTDCAFICDTYWYQVGGKDPALIIEELGNRARVIHLKDYKIKVNDWQRPYIAEIGKGNLDWDKILSVCEKIGADLVVEQDICDGDPFDSLKMSINYLKTKGY